MAPRKKTTTTQEDLPLEEFARLCSLSPDMIGIARGDRWIHVNDAFTDILGYTRKDCLSQPFSYFLHPDDIERTYAEAEKLLKTNGARTQFEVRSPTKDNSYKWISWSGRAHNGLLYLVGRDMTDKKELEEKLHQVNTFLDSIIENIPNMIFVKDAETLKFVRHNKAGEKLLGIPRKKLIGKSDHDFFPKEEADFFQEKDRAVLESGKILDIPEEPIETVKKGKRYLHTKKIPLYDADGTAQFLLGISEDITERREAKELRDAKKRIEQEVNEVLKFQQAVESASDAIVILDAHEKVIYTNPAWERMTGYSMEEATQGKKKINRFKQTDPSVIAAMKKAAKNGEHFSTEDVIFTRKNGTHYSAELNRFPIKDTSGRTLFFVSIHRDITKRKRVDASKSEFVSLAAHQLRTPLTAIRWIFSMFEDERTGELSDSQRELIDDAHKCAIQMNETITTLLMLSKVEAGDIALDLNEIDIYGLLNDVYESYKITSKEKSITVDIQKPTSKLFAVSDRKFLQQILSTLVSNAIRYTERGGTITIVPRMSGKRLTISVEDTGCGIPLHEQDKVFTKFFRAENAASVQADGLGLGLHLAKSLTKLLDGTISFTSEEGKGTTFTISLPIDYGS